MCMRCKLRYVSYQPLMWSEPDNNIEQQPSPLAYDADSTLGHSHVRYRRPNSERYVIEPKIWEPGFRQIVTGK